MDFPKMSFWLWSFVLVLTSFSATAGEEQSNAAAGGAGLQLLPSISKISKPVGSTAVVTCKSSNGTVTHWLDPKNNQISSKTHKNMELNPLPQSHGLTLTIQNLASDDRGLYTCTGLVAGEEQSKSIELAPYMGITFVNAEEEQKAKVGEDFKLRCAVKSDPGPMVDWYVDGVGAGPISSGGKYVVEPDGLQIKNVEELDDRSYRCKATVISADISDSASRIIHLQVIVPPKIDPQMKEILEVVEGEPASLECKASGKPQPVVTWIRMSTQQNITSNTEGRVYFPKITKEDDGSFRCTAENAGGRVERMVHLKVLRKPDIIGTRNTTVILGRDADIKCMVTGYPQPNVTISKLSSRYAESTVVPSGGLILTPGTYESVNCTVAELRFKNVSRNDDGIYKCVATNSIGTDAEHLRVEVQFAPSFDSIKYITEAVSWDMRPINLTCVVEANPNATVQWLFNSKNIQNDPRYVKFENPPQYTLQVIPSVRSDYGAYECLAVNPLGTNTYRINLLEGRRPSAVQSSKFEAVTATTITFKLMEPLDSGNLPISAYIVSYKNDSDNWSNSKNKTWPAGAAYVLDNLAPMATYNFRFAATNEAGISEWGAYNSTKMPERSTPNEPIILNALASEQNYIDVTTKDFQLQWSIPADNGVPIDEYHLKYCVVNQAGDTYVDKDPTECSELKIIRPPATSYVLSDLLPNNYYRVEFAAHNNIGLSTPCIRYLKTGSMVTQKSPMEELSSLSSTMMIYIVVAVIIALLVIIDLSCFVIGNTGILYTLFKCCSGKKKQKDEKLGSEGKDLISNGHGKKSDEEDMLMINNGKKDLAVEYDVKKGIAKTGFIGKDSAV